MGALEAPALVASRILNASEAAQAADDTDVTAWVKTNEFIIAFQLDEAKGPWNVAYKCRWRDVTDTGSFADLAATGEMAWGTGTTLVNGDPVTTKICTNAPVGSTWQNGEEVEGAAVSDAINLADEYYTEVWFAIDPASADNAHEYEFEIYDNDNSAAIGTALASLTIYAAPQGEVFADGFEDGTDNAWTTQQATPTVAAGNALASTSYGVSIDLSTTDEYEEKTFATAITTGVARFRFYIDPSGITSPDAVSIYVATLGGAGGSVGYAMLQYSGGSYQIRATLVDDTPSNQSTAWFNISTAEHYVEILVKRATTVSAADGSIQLWIDGVSKETLGSKDNYDRWGSSQTYIRMGNDYYTGTAGGTYKVDEMVVRDDDTEIGAVATGTQYKSLAGGLSFVGAITKKTTSISKAGALSFVGSVTKKSDMALAGVLSFAGNVYKQSYLSLAAAIGFVGSVTKQTTKSLAGVLSFVGDITQKEIGKLLAGAVGFVGNVYKQSYLSLAGVLSFVGSADAVKTFLKSLAGSLSFAGDITQKSISKSLSGAVGFVGSVVKQTTKDLAGALSFIGSVDSIKAFFKSLAGSLSFSGDITKKEIGKGLSGAVGFVGSVVKQTTKDLAGALSFSGSVNTVKTFLKSLAGSLSFAGDITKKTSIGLSGALSFTGNIVKRIGKLLSGVLGLSGSVDPEGGATITPIINLTVDARALAKTVKSRSIDLEVDGRNIDFTVEELP